MIVECKIPERDIMEKSKNLRVVKQGCGIIVNYPGVFSVDSKFLFVPCGNSIRSYNTASGLYVNSYEGFEKDAIGVCLYPNDSNKIVSVSEKGELIVWQCVKQVNHHLPKERKIMLGNYENITFLSFSIIQQYDDAEKPYVICVTKENNDEREGNVKTFSAITGEVVPFFPPMRIDCHSRSMSARYYDGEVLFAAISNTDESLYPDPTLTIFMRQKGSYLKKSECKADKNFTCVVCHPTQLCVLTGDITGNIRVYFGLFDDVPSYSSHHWHTLPVETIAFSYSGNYFYSGGGECVLVRWLSPHAKEYLPRLQAEISCIAVSQKNFVAVSMYDNGILLINSNFQIESSIQHFSISTPPLGIDYMPPCEMAFDPQSDSLVINARVGHIQFIDVERGFSKYLLDVVNRNYLTQERTKVIKNTDVVKFAINADGNWLATVEFCEDSADVPIELRLKFWEFKKMKNNYQLNTSVENPHRGKIYAVRFCPSSNDELMCITTGEDRKFRMWILEENTDLNRKGFSWVSENVGYYRDLPVRALSFSYDGSLVAVTFGPTLTVWATSTNQMKCSLTPPNAKEELTHVEFGQKTVHLVVTGTKQGIAVWNILSLSLVWVARFHLYVLVSDPNSDVMAAFSSTNDVVVFSPTKHTPLYQQKELLPLDDSRIINAVFMPCMETQSKGVSWQMSSRLYFFNNKQELLSFENPLQGDTYGEGHKLDVMPDISFRPHTAYSAILAEQIKSDVAEIPKESHLHLGLPGNKSLQDFMEGPAHTMPPLSFLAGSLMQSYIATREEDPNGAVDRKFRISEEKIGTDDSDSETEIQPSSAPEEPIRDSLAPESKVSLLEIEKRLTEIQNMPLHWVSDLLS